MSEPAVVDALRDVATYARECLVFATDYQRKQAITEALRITFRHVHALEGTPHGTTHVAARVAAAGDAPGDRGDRGRGVVSNA